MSNKRAPDSTSVVIPLLDAQTRLIEAVEAAVRHRDYEETDTLLRDAMTRIASARSANREAQRAHLGLVTIAETA